MYNTFSRTTLQLSVKKYPCMLLLQQDSEKTKKSLGYHRQIEENTKKWVESGMCQILRVHGDRVFKKSVLQNKTECYLTKKQTNSSMNTLKVFKTRQYLLWLFWCWWNAAWCNLNVSFPVYFLHAEFCPWWTLGVWVRETQFKWPVVSTKGHLWDYLSLIKSWKYFRLSWKVPATEVSGSHFMALGSCVVNQAPL